MNQLTKANARFLFLALVLLCGTVASIANKEGGYFGAALFAILLLVIFGFAADED